MTLDLARVVRQVDTMVGSLDPERQVERFDALRAAWKDLDDGEINRRFSTARTSFLLARRESHYRQTHALPTIPASYSVVATDGSMIVPNRHSPARFYMINVGTVHLRYGSDPGATMVSEPDLRCSNDDLIVESNGRRIPVSDAIVGLRRAALELSTAARTACAQPEASLALIDGSLILWTLMGQDDTTAQAVLDEYLQALWTLRERRIPVASYISAPGAADFMNTLRVSICDYPLHGRQINCDDCRMRLVRDARTPACDILPNVTDGYLMSQIAGLLPGERTGAFASDSKILDRYGPELSVRFMYLNVGSEIARLEVPAWVADDDDALKLVHAVVYDQCQLGRGYPVALQEAHEMAVIGMADRQLVDELIERRMAAAGVTFTRTGKDGSKRDRFV
ncbi:MAG TPA: DNA double-strand break repair nuclease NurA [Thermomicrobiales bacterium]|nr:DNA double-strand break repair nuclease NurA [Thermomicrobiales bacterium]